VSRPKIGIVDDEAAMRDALVALLADNQFDPVPLANIAEYRAAEANTALDLVLIDLQLRDESGLTLAMDIRRTQDLPIVMLTGRGDETDKIVGLEIGADDYVLKPFNPRELVARIRAVLRRYGKSEERPSADIDPSRVTFGRLTVDQKQRILFDDANTEISLTNAKYVDRTVDVLILRLRRKIEENPSKPVHLQTRRGQGYIFVTDSARGGQ